MQQPPNDQPWQQPQQPNTQYPSQQPPPQWQPQYPPPNTYYPPGQWQQPPRPPKKQRPLLTLAIIVGVLIFLGVISSAVNKSSPEAQATPTTDIVQATDTPSPAATDTPSPTPTPTISPVQTEKLYKALTKNTTVVNLDKDGNADKGKDVHFTCKILKFVKDDSGNTAGANVESSDTSSFTTSVIQVIFPSGTDVTKLNEGDTLEVWGTDEGVFSGKNAFGGDVQEVGVGALYMTDTTTNYQTS